MQCLGVVRNRQRSAGRFSEQRKSHNKRSTCKSAGEFFTTVTLI